MLSSLGRRSKTIDNKDFQLPQRKQEDLETINAIVEQLKYFIGEDAVSTDPQTLARHGKDLTGDNFQPPDIVAYPHSSQQVATIVEICQRYRFPIIPFGSGSSLEGQVLAPKGGLTMDFRKMNRILSVRAEDGNCTVQAGVTCKQLNEVIHDRGLFFSVDPGVDATIGGLAGTIIFSISIVQLS